MPSATEGPPLTCPSAWLSAWRAASATGREQGPAERSGRQLRVLALLAVTGAAVALDLALPSWTSGGLLYLAPVLLALARHPKREALVTAGACTLLGLGVPLVHVPPSLFHSPTPSEPFSWVALGDRGLSVGVLWIIVVLGWRRRAIEASLHDAEARYRGIYEGSKDAIGYVALDGRLLDVNGAFLLLTGYSREELLSKTCRDVTTADHREREAQMLERVLRTGEAAEFEKDILRRDGTQVPVAATAMVVKDAVGAPVGLAEIMKDLTERRQTEARLRELAYYDCLTGLPNRRLFMELLKQSLSRAGRIKAHVAVFFLDLDGFKLVNDTLGHQQGDVVLKVIAERLATCVRASDVLSRQGGDEFTFVLEHVGTPDDASRIAQKILHVTAQPCTVEGHEIALTGSIGIAFYPTDATDADALIQHADTAMYAAKATGNTFRFYSADMHERALERLRLGSELRRALHRQEFVLHYQPIVDAHTRGISGVEALIRWQHPERGLVSPATFIPLAEETDVIVPMTEWVLRTACAQTRSWQAGGHAGLRVAVNLSRRLFRDAGLVDLVRRILDETGLSPSSLELELTESLLIKDRERTVAMLQALHALGVRISIDDFGIEYSSLGYLKQLPITTLKIDQSFVRDIVGSEADTAIAQVVITLGRCRNLTVVAEGVEAEAQAGFLSAQRCHELQGYYFSGPVPAEVLTTLLLSPKHLGPTLVRL